MTNIYTSVAKNVLSFIEDNNLQIGDKLPSERELATRFNVSRSSVREGIRTLVNKGVLNSRRGDGTYVAMPEQTHLEGPLIKVLKNSVSSKDIFQLRYILEPQVAALAAMNATPEQVNNLKIMAFDMSHHGLSDSEVTALDIQFHLAIAKCAKNELLVNLIDCLGDILALSRRENHDQDDRVSMAAKAHFKIVEAIADGKPDAAQEAMKEHIQYIELKFREDKETP